MVVYEYEKNDFLCVWYLYKTEKNDTYILSNLKFASQILQGSKVGYFLVRELSQALPSEKEIKNLWQWKVGYDVHNYLFRTLHPQVFQNQQDDAHKNTPKASKLQDGS